MTQPKLPIVPPVAIEEPSGPQPERPTFFIELGKLYIDWEKNARTRYDDTEGMAAALNLTGQINPLICVERKDEQGQLRMELVEGFSRVKAWQKMYPKTWETHRVEVKLRKALRDGDERLLGLQANMVRHNLRTSDLAREVWQLHRKYGFSVEWLVRHTSIGKAKMHAMILVWGNLCKEVREAWIKASHEDVFPWTVIQKWASLPDEEAQIAALHQHLGDADVEPEPPKPVREKKERQARPTMADIRNAWERRQEKEPLSARDEVVITTLAWVLGKGELP